MLPSPPLPNPPHPVLPVRAWHAWRDRGTRYAWHKVLRRTLGRWPGWKRRLIYADARSYWTLRGGDEYFREQEGQAARTARARWLAEQIARYRPGSILEVGCGYGKQLGELRRLLDVPLAGVDFSPTQLARARGHLAGLDRIDLVLGSGQALPFGDKAFDLVLTSAVILHNPPPAAERIRREVLRVARRWAAHNEDTDVSYNRYGYDTAAWYRAAGIPLAEAGPMPLMGDGGWGTGDGEAGTDQDSEFSSPSPVPRSWGTGDGGRGTDQGSEFSSLSPVPRPPSPINKDPNSQFCVAELWRP